MKYIKANESDLDISPKNRYHKLCEELDYAMQMNSHVIEVNYKDEYKNVHSAWGALYGAIVKSKGVYPFKVAIRGEKLLLIRKDME